MNSNNFNVKKYSNINLNNNVQNVGIFVSDEVYKNLNEGCIPLLELFEDINSNFNPYIIQESEFEDVWNHLLNDKLYLDIIIIYGYDFDLDFLKLLISKSKIFGVNVIYDLSQSIEDNFLDNFLSKEIIIRQVNHLMVSNEDFKTFFKDFNENISVIPDLSYSNNDKLSKTSSNDFSNFTSVWLTILNMYKRNKEGILYEYASAYLNKNLDYSFQNFLIENSFDIINKSNLFDEEWYLSQYPDVKQIDIHPINHYISLGVNEGCIPNESFITNNYKNKLNPLVSEILYGNSDKSEEYFLIKSSNLFDEEWYLSQYPDISVDPIIHFLDIGCANNFNPSKDFDVAWYLEKYVDVKNSNINPFIHYIKYGQYEDRFPNRISYYEHNKINKKDVNRNMEILENSNLFDEESYLEKYNDVKNSRFSGLEHYVLYGFNEVHRSPDGYFSNIFYRDNYLGGDNSEWNPLTHYALIGQFKNYKKNIFDLAYIDYSYDQLDRILAAFKQKISIVLFVFDKPGKELDKSIKSIRNNTHLDYNIFIINYTSHELGCDYGADVFVFNYHSPNFSRDVKVNIINSKNDFFFLTNYTEVSYRWLEKLIIKAYSEENVAMVTPLSNNIRDISPDYFNSITKSHGLTVSGLSKLIERVSLNNYRIQVPFINISGVYIKNKHISLSNFNINSFLFNPNERICGWDIENDLINILDDSTYIYQDSKFYENLSLDKKNNWFSSSSLEEFINLDSLDKIVGNIENSITHVNNKLLSNKILCFIKEDDLNFYNDYLTLYNKDYFEFYFLTIKSNDINLWNFYSGKFNKIKSWNLNYTDDYLMNSYLQNIYFNILSSFNIDVVQFNYIDIKSFELVNVANSLKIPLICGCDNEFYSTYCDLKLNNDLCFDLFSCIDHLVFFDKYFKNMFEKSDLIHDEISEDVLNFSNLEKVRSKLYSFNEKIKILIPGNLINFSDYFELIRIIKNMDLENSIEFHFLGDTPYLNGCGINHGKFSKSSLIQVVNEISPNFICLFSIFEDIFDVIDIAQLEKIPIIISYDELLSNMVDGFEGINIIENGDLECLSNSFIHLTSFDNYYKNIKELYMEDKYFKNEVVFFNKVHEDLYLSFGDTSKKRFVKKSRVDKPKDNYKELFPNFEGFLANSYVSPIFEADFREECKECFAVMDNVSKYLISKVRDVKITPLVSIIMPVYNRENVILTAINSVLNQSYENFELIIIDDCSTDGTRNILKNLSDSRISVIYLEKNGGASQARNAGLEVANGLYVAYLDSDNEWDSRYLESTLGAFFELPDADAVYSGQLLYEGYDSKPFAVRFGAYNKSLLLNHNYIDLNCFCHKLSIFNEIGGFDNELYRLEDWDFILRISNNYKMYSVPILLSKYYYQNANNRISDLSIDFLNYTDLIHERNKFTSKNLDFSLNKKVNIIIPNYESLKDLRECVDAILSFDLDLLKLIIVDNDSNDAVKYYLHTLESNDKIKIIFNEFNYGFTYAVNQGIAISESDADILLLNNDAILTEGAIESLQKYAYSLKNCGIVVPQQVLPGETPTLNVHVPYASPIHECDVNPSQHHENIINMPLFHNGEILELNFAPFFCTYIKRDVLDDSMGLDAELGRHYRSDRMYSDYVRTVMGFKIYHVSDALVYHKLQKATAKLKEDKDDYDMMFVKNQWEPELMEKLGYKKALWDD